MDIYSIKSRLRRSEDCWKWSEEDRKLAHELLRGDTLYHRIPEFNIKELTEVALAVGADTCGRVVQHYNCSDPLRLARMLKVRVLFDISPSRKNSSVNILSSYRHAPPTISVYEGNLRACREFIMKKNKVNKIYLSNLTNICVAHEIYHHLERCSLTFVDLAYKVPVLDLKIFRIEKSLTTLSEIAANAFAMKLMNLPGLPCVINRELKGENIRL